MAGGLWNTIKTWINGEVVYSGDLNAEFQNVISNMSPDKFDNYSRSTPEIQSQESPSDSGGNPIITPQPGLSLANEIKRLRYMISQITGKTYWYQNPDRTLSSEVFNSGRDICLYFPFEGQSNALGYPNELLLQDCAKRGAFLFFLDQLLAFSNFSKFGSHSLNTQTSYVAASAGKCGVNVGALSLFFRSLNPGDYIACNPLLGISLYLDASGFLVLSMRTDKATLSESSKDIKTISGSLSRSGDTTFRHVCIRYKSNQIDGAATDYLKLSYEGSDEGTQLLNQTIYNANGMYAGSGFWIFGAKENQASSLWTKYSAMKVLPSAEGSSPWALSGTAGLILPSGCMQLSTGGNYNKTVDLLSSKTTVEFMVKLDNPEGNNNANYSSNFKGWSPVRIKIGSNAKARSCFVGIHPHYMSLKDNYSASGNENRLKIYHNFTKWSLVRLCIDGTIASPIITIYIDGVVVGQFILNSVDGFPADLISFGNESALFVNSFWNYFSYSSANSIAPLTFNANGQLDEICMLRREVSDIIVSGLKANDVKSYLGNDFYSGTYLPPDSGPMESTGKTTNITMYYDLISTASLFSDGENDTEITVSGTVSNDTAGTATTKIALGFGDDNQDTIFGPPAESVIVQSIANQELPFCIVYKATLRSRINTVNLFGLVSGGTSTFKNVKFSFKRAS